MAPCGIGYKNDNVSFLSRAVTRLGDEGGWKTSLVYDSRNKEPGGESGPLHDNRIEWAAAARRYDVRWHGSNWRSARSLEGDSNGQT